MAYEGSPKYLTLYDMEHVEALQGNVYRWVGPGYYSSCMPIPTRKKGPEDMRLIIFTNP